MTELLQQLINGLSVGAIYSLIARGGMDNGAWFHSKHLWIQNEDTASMKNLVDRRSFEELLR